MDISSIAVCIGSRGAGVIVASSASTHVHSLWRPRLPAVGSPLRPTLENLILWLDTSPQDFLHQAHAPCWGGHPFSEVLGFSLRQARQRTATCIKPTGLLSSISHATLIPFTLCHFKWKTISSYHPCKCSRPKLGFPELGPSLWQVWWEFPSSKPGSLP